MKKARAGMALIAGLLAAPAPGLAQEVRAVVELFTSQGCSSCPPADRLLTELTRERNLVALTMPVDYWDYLGWKDTLAQPMFTARQRAYGGARGDHAVYTPQAVVNGLRHALGSDRAAIEKAASAGPLPIAVTIEENGAGARVRLPAAAGHSGPADVLLLPVKRAQKVTISRGENTGQVATYSNVARAIHKLGSWNGAAANFEVPPALVSAAEADGFAVLVQAGKGPGRVFGAAYSRALRPAN
jgi:hypothetical protein